MIKDRNKGISNITYNHLNLPTQIEFEGTNDKITYLYPDAFGTVGQKLKKTVVYSYSIKIVDYLDGFQYVGGELNFFPHPEGYVSVKRGGRTAPDGSQGYVFNYVFNYTDHLDERNQSIALIEVCERSSVRVSYSKDPQTNQLKILEENHYYPFGLKHSVYSAGRLRDFEVDFSNPEEEKVFLTPVTKTEYQYKYNSFEYQNELGLNWYDYMARNYDPALGRWMNVDPLAEMSRKFSPYTYAFDNPIYFIDPDGMMAESFDTDMEPMVDIGYDRKIAASDISGSVQFSGVFDMVNKNGENSNTAQNSNNDSFENSNNGEFNDAINSTEQDCCPDGKPKVEAKLDMSSETKSINFAYVQNNYKETVYYKSEGGSEKEFISSNGTIHEKVDGIRVGNTVIKVSDGYRSVVIDKSGNVKITYGDPFTYGYYLWRGGELQSSPDSGWDKLFDEN